MRLVMIGEIQRARKPRQLRAHAIRKLQLQIGPDRHRLLEQREAARRECDRGFHQPVPFHQRPFVERDRVQVAGGDSFLRQAELRSVGGEARIVLPSGKSLFLSRRDDLSVADEGGGRVVIEGGDAEDVGSHAGVVCHFLRMNRPMTSMSRPVPKNTRTASRGLQTIGS